jgi:hypothetical protein
LNLGADAVEDIIGSNDLLRSLLNNIPGIVYRGMPDWSLTFIGGEVERFTGYASGEILGNRMGGKEALDAMRRLRPDLAALFTSGYSNDRIHESFVLLPGIELFPKPYGPASLARRVREVLDKI